MLKLLPDFPRLARDSRLVMGTSTRLQPTNVDVVAIPMSYTDVVGIVTTDGKHRPVGAAIWATGFDMSFQARFPTYS
jgi:hypothetical protein